jgi:preprotein translocase subunit SecG
MGSSLLIYFLGAVLCFASLVMILLVLLQRGRGGGLAGAFGGMGGQSALGVRAGDVFTKITVVIAVIWVVVAGLLGISMRAADVAKKDQWNPDLGLPSEKADDVTDDEGVIDEGPPIVAPTATADDPETEKAETGAAKTDPASDPASTTEIPEAVEGKKAESAETTPDEAAAPEEKTDSVAAEKKDEPAPEAEPE